MPSKRLIASLLMIAALLLSAALALAASVIAPASSGLYGVAPVTSTPVPTPTELPAVWTAWDPNDGRINPEPAAPLAIYCGTDSIHASLPSGLAEFNFPSAQIGAVSQSALLLAEGATGARLYRLSTGEFQVNMVHDGEEYVFTWNNCPATLTTTRVYDLATGALRSVFTRPR